MELCLGLIPLPLLNQQGHHFLCVEDSWVWLQWMACSEQVTVYCVEQSARKLVTCMAWLPKCNSSLQGLLFCFPRTFIVMETGPLAGWRLSSASCAYIAMATWPKDRPPPSSHAWKQWPFLVRKILLKEVIKYDCHLQRPALGLHEPGLCAASHGRGRGS